MWNEWDNGPRSNRLSGLGKTADEAAVKAAVTAAGCLQQWKQANRPLDLNFCSTVGGTATGGGLLAPQPGQVPTTLPAPAGQVPATPAPGSTTPGSGSSAASGISDFFSEIPSTYLFIGGAIVVFMMLKKR